MFLDDFVEKWSFGSRVARVPVFSMVKLDRFGSFYRCCPIWPLRGSSGPIWLHSGLVWAPRGLSGPIRPGGSKTGLWRPPGATLRPGARNPPKWASGGLLGVLSGLVLEMLEIGPPEASWGYFLAWCSHFICIFTWV